MSRSRVASPRTRTRRGVGLRVWFGVALGCVVALVVAAPGLAAPPDVDCKKGDDLQAAINDDAVDGDTLRVKGPCVGTFAIGAEAPASRTIDGVGKATIDGNSEGTVLTIEEGKTAVLKDLRITGGAGSTFDAVGVSVTLVI